MQMLHLNTVLRLKAGTVKNDGLRLLWTQISPMQGEKPWLQVKEVPVNAPAKLRVH